MKMRYGFVSNSSSCSCIVVLKNTTYEEIAKAVSVLPLAPLVFKNLYELIDYIYDDDSDYSYHEKRYKEKLNLDKTIKNIVFLLYDDMSYDQYDYFVNSYKNNKDIHSILSIN